MYRSYYSVVYFISASRFVHVLLAVAWHQHHNPPPRTAPWCGDAGPRATPDAQTRASERACLNPKLRKRDTQTQRSGQVAPKRSLYLFPDSHREAVKLRRRARETVFTPTGTTATRLTRCGGTPRNSPGHRRGTHTPRRRPSSSVTERGSLKW